MEHAKNARQVAWGRGKNVQKQIEKFRHELGGDETIEYTLELEKAGDRRIFNELKTYYVY